MDATDGAFLPGASVMGHDEGLFSPFTTQKQLPILTMREMCEKKILCLKLGLNLVDDSENILTNNWKHHLAKLVPVLLL